MDAVPLSFQPFGQGLHVGGFPEPSGPSRVMNMVF
jgi:hypothetical protein